MPREVYFEPSGSPFVQSTASNHHLHDMSTESSLTDLSVQYLQDNDDLNSSNGLAGLADVTVGMGDETSVMRLQTSESDEFLMGVSGGEFLADDSMMGDTPFLSRSTRARSKLSQSTSFPPALVEAAEAQVEELVQVEKPKRKKSTRSRSSSPSKKSLATDPPAETAPAFPQIPMETMPEEPEPEPEPETKPRRSPRKARTRPPSTAEPPSVFPTTSSPFASSSTPPVSEPILPPEPAVEPEPAAEPQTARKTKRTSRVVGRAKSKSRSKSAQIEEPLEEDLQSATTKQEATTPQGEAPGPDPQRLASPLIPNLSPPIETRTPEATLTVTQVEGRISPTPPPPHHNLATTQNDAPKPPHIRAESGPAPFKFQLPPSFGRSRTQSATPLLGASTSARMSFGMAASSPEAPKNHSVPRQEEQEPKEPTPEEAAEAVAAAMRILRRDSMVFGHPRQSFASEPVEAHTPQGTPPVVPLTIPEEHTPTEQASNETTPIETAPAKRTRVGRKSTRARGGARASVAGRKVETVHEQEQEITPVSSPPVAPSPPSVAPTPEVNETPNDEVQDTIEEEEQDIAVPVNFGSRSPSPTTVPESSATPPRPIENVSPEPQPETPANLGTPSPEPNVLSVSEPTKAPNALPPREFPAKKRTTRSSMPAQTSHAALPARTTRATRKSEVRPAPSRGDSGRVTKSKETVIEEGDMPEEDDKPDEGVALAEEAVTPTRADVTATPIASTTPLDSPALPMPMVSEETVEVPPLDAVEEMQDVQEPAKEAAIEPAPSKVARQQKGLGSSAKRVPQRAVSTSQSNAPQRTASGSSQTRRTVSSTTQKPGQPTRVVSATQKPASKSNESAGSPTLPSGPQRAALASSQKSNPQKPSSSSKPPSTTSAPSTSTRPTRAAVQKAEILPVAAVSKEAERKPSPVPIAKVAAPETKARAVRALPKRSARLSKEAKVAPIAEDSMDISSTDPEVVPEVQQDKVEEPVADELVTPEFQRIGTIAPTSIWPREPAANPFAPVSLPTEPDVRASPRSGKRRASTPEPEPQEDANDSPSKRVRFSSVLEAGPTPGIGRVLQMPKPSLKVVKKPKFERKANRPKRVLTRDWVVGEAPSYAAPLKRDVREREVHVAPADRAPLSETQANTRVVNDKMKPTVPIAFTFRSELRMKPRADVEEFLPTGIPIATPMPDFAAAHAAAEAANLLRRQNAQEAFLAAQTELESCRHSKYAIGSETARRAAERAVFDAATKVKEAEAERVRMEQSRLEAEKEATEIKEMRRKMVPKANPVPEFYRHIAKNNPRDVETE